MPRPCLLRSPIAHVLAVQPRAKPPPLVLRLSCALPSASRSPCQPRAGLERRQRSAAPAVPRPSNPPGQNQLITARYISSALGFLVFPTISPTLQLRCVQDTSDAAFKLDWTSIVVPRHTSWPKRGLEAESKALTDEQITGPGCRADSNALLFWRTVGGAVIPSLRETPSGADY